MSVLRKAWWIDGMCCDVRDEEREDVAQVVRREPGLFYFSFLPIFLRLSIAPKQGNHSGICFAASGWGEA